MRCCERLEKGLGAGRSKGHDEGNPVASDGFPCGECSSNAADPRPSRPRLPAALCFCKSIRETTWLSSTQDSRAVKRPQGLWRPLWPHPPMTLQHLSRRCRISCWIFTPYPKPQGANGPSTLSRVPWLVIRVIADVSQENWPRPSEGDARAFHQTYSPAIPSTAVLVAGTP